MTSPLGAFVRLWWELRFFGHAAAQRDFNDLRVQALVDEKLRRDRVHPYDGFTVDDGLDV